MLHVGYYVFISVKYSIDIQSHSIESYLIDILFILGNGSLCQFKVAPELCQMYLNKTGLMLIPKIMQNCITMGS